MDPDQARRAAALELRIEPIKERVRDVRTGVTIDTLTQDSRYALRYLRHSPGFAVAAILTLALGIGPTTAMFSVVNSVLLRPLPYPHADQLVRIMERADGAPTGVRMRMAGGGMELTEVDVLRVRTKSLSHLAAYEVTTSTLTSDGDSVSVEAARVSATIFDMLGVRALLGRPYDLTHEKGGGQPVVVLSHSLWQERFGRQHDVIGHIVAIDGRDHTVIGVMPRGFEFPPETPTRFWTPFVPATSEFRSYRPVIAKLADGMTLTEAAAEVSSIINQHRRSLNVSSSMAARIPSGKPPPPPPPPPATAQGMSPRQPPPRRELPPPPILAPAEFSLERVQDQLVAPVRRALQGLSIAVVFLLLIACANAANLLLARAASRDREFAVRTALGAGRRRIAAQLLTESTLVTVAAATVGTLLALALVQVMRELGATFARQDLGLAGGVPRIREVQVDAPALLFTVLVALLSSTAFGLAPLWRSTRGREVERLRSHMSTTDGGFNLWSPHHVRGLLVMTQVTMAVILLIGGGLLTKSLLNLSTVDPGYDINQVLTFQLRTTRGQPLSSPLFDPREVPPLLGEYDRVVEQIGRIPGVRAVGYSQSLPMVRTLNVVVLRMTPDPPRVQGRPSPPDFSRPLPPETPNVRAVSSAFLDAMGVAIVSGRGLQDSDDSGRARALLINRTLAESGFLWDAPLGRQIYAVGREPWEIVGIVDDVRRFGLDQQPDPQIFVDFRQAPEMLFGGPPMNFAVRTTGNPGALAPAILKSLRQLDPSVTMDRVAPTGQLMSASLSRSRLYASLVGSFALIALMLTALGVYAILAYAVTQRTTEIGIRLALGASGLDIVTMVIRQAVVLVAIGLALGLAGAVGATRGISAMLFGVTPLDLATYVAVAVLFAVVAVAAALAPLRRATRVDPVVALRAE
jgi:predicted permease